MGTRAPEFNKDNFTLNNWLSSINCSQYYELFVENEIEDFDLVTQLDYETFQELGISKIGDLVRLERSVSSLKIQEGIQKSSGLADEFINRVVKFQMNSKIKISQQNKSVSSFSQGNTISDSENETGIKISVKDDSRSSAKKKQEAQDNNAISIKIDINNPSNSGTDDTDCDSDMENESGKKAKSNTDSDEENDDTTGSAAPKKKSQVSSNGKTQNGPHNTKNKEGTHNKSVAVFILPDGSLKKINILGCFSAESIKKKLLKKMEKKDEKPEDYKCYIVDSNETIHLLVDVELVSIVHSPEKPERKRIMLCKASEDPSPQALEMSKKMAQRYESQSKRKVHKKKEQDKVEKESEKETKVKDPPYARKRSELRPLYEQRPPSELISTNLAEYFPETSSSELQKTIRNSVRYSVRMSRAYSRLSMMSMAGPNFNRQSVYSANLPNSPRTIGDVIMTNKNELDDASGLLYKIPDTPKKPKRFIPAADAPLPSRKLGENVGTTSSPVTPRRQRKGANGSPNPFDSPQRVNKRLSIAINSTKDRNSRIELLDVGNTDSEEESGIDDEDPESVIKDLEAESEMDTGPQHWLRGRKIGAGSFGVVYLGLNSFTGELMAVKQVELPKVSNLTLSTKTTSDDTKTNSSTLKSNNSDESSTLKDTSTLRSDKTLKKTDEKDDHKKNMIDALQREMAILKELKHDKIVRYLGSSSDGMYLNIFLEYVPGGSITSMLTNYGPFKEPLIRNFTRQILIGLKYLHSKNIIHRDIKGGNILIDNNGGAKISDFGISKKIETSSSKRASLQGSVYWMAPEVVGQVANSEKSDIWSVGCLIIEMFTGRHPFPDLTQMQAIFKIGTKVTPKIPDWSTEDCQDFLKKTFILEYDKRPSAQELLGHQFLNSLIMSDS